MFRRSRDLDQKGTNNGEMFRDSIIIGIFDQKGAKQWEMFRRE